METEKIEEGGNYIHTALGLSDEFPQEAVDTLVTLLKSDDCDGLSDVMEAFAQKCRADEGVPTDVPVSILEKKLMMGCFILSNIMRDSRETSPMERLMAMMGGMGGEA